MTSPWFISHDKRTRATVRLYCFPNAGVGASTFRLWSKGLPEHVEVRALQSPGRESRLREAPLSSIDDLVRAALPHLETDLPFALFGHSMGAVVAFEMASALRRTGGAQPSHLFVSARRPPHVKGTETAIHGLSDEEFVRQVQRRYGGIPAAVLAEPDVMALLLPALRADFAALETHQPGPPTPLACPISAWGGDRDPLATPVDLALWREATTERFTTRTFQGGHFYIHEQREALLSALNLALPSPMP